MNIRQLITHCLDRHESPLRNHKSVMHAVDGDITHPYHPEVFYADKRSIMATDLEEHGISIVPIHVGGNPIAAFTQMYGQNAWHLFFTMRHWEFEHWLQSYGFQMFTGKPSGDWTDLDFEFDAIKEHPYETMGCIENLCKLTDTPLIAITKSGGIRFSCRTPGYVRSRSDMEYVARYADSTDAHGNPIRLNLFLEIFGDKSLSRWDGRYEIVSGEIIDPPVIEYPVLLDALAKFKRDVHVDPPVRKPRNRKPKQEQTHANSQTYQIKGRYTIDNLPKDLEWKRIDVNNPSAGLKSKRSDYRCTITKHRKSMGNMQFYKKLDGTVSVYCHNCKNRPIGGKPLKIGKYHKSEKSWIADLIANAPPYEEVPSKEEQRKNLISRIRGVEESPTALRRPNTVLEKSEDTSVYTTLEENDKEILLAFKKDKKLVLLNSETGAGKNFQMEAFVMEGGKIIKTTPTTPLAVADIMRMHDRGIKAFHWKARDYLWELQQERSQNDLLFDPFGNGAVCIDAVRCNKLFAKGGHARKSICPYCEVYETCQTQGYLSQEDEAAHADVVVIAMQHLFFNPEISGFANRLIKFKELTNNDDGEPDWKEINRIGVLDEGKAHTFYLYCELTKSQLQVWRDMWDNTELGGFSIKMIEILEVDKGGFSIENLRGYITGISAEDSESIHAQMRMMRVEGEVFKRRAVDKETNEVLAELSMRFKPSGAEVYIAKDEYAYETLRTEKNMPCLPPKSYKPTEMIQLSLDQALAFGVHSIETETDIENIPKIAGENTILHELQNVFGHYTLDDNTPMSYDGQTLEWYVPPVLLSNLQRLVIMGASLNIDHAKRTFQIPEKDIAPVFTSPTPYKDGNHVFQIRTGAYPRKSLMHSEKDDNGEWQWKGLKAAGDKFLGYIRSCVEENTSQHAVITFKQIAEWHSDEWMSRYGVEVGTETQNLRFFGHFGKMEGLSKVFDEVNHLWIVGLPEVAESDLQRNTKMVFGVDDEPLVWDRSDTREYVDIRVQSIYESMVLAMVEQAVGRARLNRLINKRVYLFTGVRIKSITDRKETLLFDFADCEIATSLSELKDVIEKRQCEEQAEQDKEDAIRHFLIQGQSGGSLIKQGFSRNLVDRIVMEMRSELKEVHKQQEVRIVELAQQKIDDGDSLRKVSRDLGKSRDWLKTRIKC